MGILDSFFKRNPSEDERREREVQAELEERNRLAQEAIETARKSGMGDGSEPLSFEGSSDNLKRERSYTGQEKGQKAA